MSTRQQINENELDYIFPPETILIDEEEHKLYNVFLPMEITDEYVHDHEELKNIIRLLRSYHVAGHFINIHCRGWGGCTIIGTELINSINTSMANTRMTVTANCYSMHTIIALSQAKNIEIENGVQFMFHESQMSLGGGMDNMRRDLVAAMKDDKALDKHVKAFLTKKEYKEMVEGRNVYVTGADMKKRIKAKFERKTKRKKAEDN